jgi:hypothetical protein
MGVSQARSDFGSEEDDDVVHVKDQGKSKQDGCSALEKGPPQLLVLAFDGN